MNHLDSTPLAKHLGKKRKWDKEENEVGGALSTFIHLDNWGNWERSLLPKFPHQAVYSEGSRTIVEATDTVIIVVIEVVIIMVAIIIV